MAISGIALVALAALLFVLVAALANPRTRPFVIGLGVIIGLGFMFLLFAKFTAVSNVQHQATLDRFHEAQERFTREQPEIVNLTPQVKLNAAPTSPPGTGNDTHRPKTTLLAALEQALLQAWTNGDARPLAEAPQKPTITNPPVAPEKSALPAWVDYVEPRMQNGVYEMSVLVGPFTTQLECERELPKAVQRAVSEYAELSLGPDAARITLPDDVLKGLVQARVTDARQMEIDGGSRVMYSLHALVVFDTDMQQLLKSEARRPVIGQRVKIAAAIFGGLFGLLTVAWAGLSWMTRRQQRAAVERTHGQPGSASGSFPGSVVLSAVVVTVVVVVLAALL